MPKKLSRFILPGLIMISLAACEKPKLDQTPIINEAPVVQMEEQPEENLCKTEIVVSSSSQNFIRLNHPTNLINESENQAVNWCSKFDKSAILTKQKCGVCCTSSYFCN